MGPLRWLDLPLGCTHILGSRVTCVDRKPVADQRAAFQSTFDGTLRRRTKGQQEESAHQISPSRLLDVKRLLSVPQSEPTQRSCTAV